MRLLIRADASPTIGLGHLSRTSSLVDAARERGLEVVYLVAPDPLATAFLAKRGLAYTEIDPDDWAGSVDRGDVVVLDGYHLGGERDVEAARARGARVGAIDDLGRKDLAVDVLVNPNEPPTHALVRRAFRERRRLRDARASTLLLTFGGADVAGLGAAANAQLRGNGFATTLLVEGPGSGQVPSDWLERVRDPDDVPAVFDRADAALCSAGSTVWELLAMGVPVALAAIVDNQAGIARTAIDAGAAISLDPERMSVAADALASPARRRELSAAALDLIDGRGPERVIDALLG